VRRGTLPVSGHEGSRTNTDSGGRYAPRPRGHRSRPIFSSPEQQRGNSRVYTSRRLVYLYPLSLGVLRCSTVLPVAPRLAVPSSESWLATSTCRQSNEANDTCSPVRRNVGTGTHTINWHAGGAVWYADPFPHVFPLTKTTTVKVVVFVLARSVFTEERLPKHGAYPYSMRSLRPLTGHREHTPYTSKIVN